MEQDRVAGLVIRSNPLFLFRYNTALLFRSDSDFYKRFADILLNHVRAASFCRVDRRFIQKVFKVSSGKSRRSLSDLMKIHIVAQRLVLGVYLQNLFPAFYIRPADRDLPVKTSRTHDGRIQNIHPVCRGHDNDALVGSKAVHLYQKLIQRLLPLVVSAAHTGTAASRHRVDLIDEYDTRAVLFGAGKQIPYSGRAHAHKHLHKIRAGYAEKRHSRFPGHRFGDQRLSSSGRPHQQYSFGDTRSHLCVFSGVSQKIYDLFQFAFLLIQSGHILETGFGVPGHRHLCPALSKIQHLSVASSGIPAERHNDEKQHDAAHQKRRSERDQKSRSFHLRHVIGHARVFQQSLHTLCIQHMSDTYRTVFQRIIHRTGRRLFIGLDLCVRNLPFFQTLYKRLVGVSRILDAPVFKKHQQRTQKRENQQIAANVFPLSVQSFLSSCQSNSTTPI